MKQKAVSVRIAPDGACTIDALHFTDATCKHATEQILQALGGQRVRETEKPEARALLNRPNGEREASR